MKTEIKMTIFTQGASNVNLYYPSKCGSINKGISISFGISGGGVMDVKDFLEFAEELKKIIKK